MPSRRDPLEFQLDADATGDGVRILADQLRSWAETLDDDIEAATEQHGITKAEIVREGTGYDTAYSVIPQDDA